jgi:hypothetical protein
VIDARDLTEWIVRMAENRTPGVFNATGAEDGLTFRRMLDICRTESDRHRPMDKTMTSGLSRERELDLLNDAPHPAH